TGTVRADTDNNDTGDTPLPGVTVYLDIDGSGTLNAGDISTTTNAAGGYSFPALAPGDYDVVEVDFGGYQSVSDTDGGDPNLTSPVAVTAGATTPNIDFVDEELGAIAGTVRADTDNNDTGDTPLASVTVFLDSNGNGSFDGGEPTTTTSGAGTWSFTGLAPGNYNVIQVDLANYQSVSDTDGGDPNLTTPVAVTAGATTANIDFVDEELAVIGGEIWSDMDGNGLDDDLTSLGGVVVNLLTGDGSTQLDTTTSAGPNTYSFAALPPGDYMIEFELPPSRFFTLQDVGADDTIDSDANPGTGRTVTITLSAGETNDTVDAGMYQLTSINGTVRADTDNNDTGDVGLAGVTVFLDSNDNGSLDGGETSVLTDGSGDYSFPNLVPGYYNVVSVDLPNYQSISDTDGGDANRTQGVLARSANPENGIDFVDEELASVGDFVWHDADFDGIQNDGPASGLGGVTVNLFDASGTIPLGTTSTSTDGSWSFTGLDPTGYIIEFVKPAGFVTSPENQGGNDSLDSDADPGDGRTPLVTLSAGENDLDIDAGYDERVGVGNLVFIDANGNGVADAGEGAANVLVQLFAQGDDPQVDAPLVTALTNVDGNFLFTGLQPGTYFLHVPAGMFDGGPLAGNVAIRTAGADDGTDDNGDQNAIYYGDPKVEGSTSTEFTLGFGTEPVDAGTENGNGTFWDTAFKDDNVDLTIDLGYYASCGLSATATNIVRNDEGTPTLSDDTFGFDVTVTATNGDPFGWFASRLDGPSEFPGGNYDQVYPFGPYPVAQTPSYLFEDGGLAADPCEFTLTVPAPAVAPARIANYVFRDQNGDGLQDAGDLPLNGVTVRLLDGTGTPFTPDLTDVTDTSGLYEFTDLQPGNYIVEFVLPATFTFTGAHVGADDAVDSDADPITGRTPVIVLAEGEDNDTIDAGLTQLASISDLVWNDLNADGFLNGSEGGIPGVRVFIDLDDDDTYDAGEPEAITNGSGTYLIGNLAGGTYEVLIDASTLPDPAYVVTKDRDATADGMTSVTLANGEAVTDADFGYRLVKPDNFTDYATGHGLTGTGAQPVPDGGGNGGNPDDDYRSNILEHALCDDPTTGVPNHAGFCIEIANPATGRIDATIVRPTGIQDVIYTLEGRDSLTGNGTDGQGWFTIATIAAGGAVPAPFTVTLNPDGTETLTYPDLVGNVAALTDAYGLLRLTVSLDADQNAVPDTLPSDGTTVTDSTETFGWQQTDCNAAECATISHPFAEKPVFTASVIDNTGPVLDLSVSAGGVDLSTVIPGGGTHYVQVTSGQHEGHRFDVAGASGNTITLVSDPDIFDESDGADSLNTMDGVPANSELAEATIEVLPYLTIDEVFDKTTTFAANEESDPNLAARVITFHNRRNSASFEMLILIDNGSEVKWIRSYDLGLQVDQGGNRLDPGAGIFVHPRMLGLTQPAIGRVAGYDVRGAFNEGYNLAAAPYPQDQTLTGPGGRGYTVANGFTGGIDPSRSSELLQWKGDLAVDTGATYAEFYTQHMQLDGASMQRWTDINDPALTDVGPTLLLESHRAAVLKLVPGQTIKSHRYLQP
ncbi:MAG: hypothetical protein HKO57_16445, partial [Akkermansiaceae bacterium]|nr:hypothetical protein [Akkermansiaceae bacterium]